MVSWAGLKVGSISANINIFFQCFWAFSLFPSEPKSTLNNFFHKLKRLVYPWLHQGSEMNHSHIHLWFGNKISAWNHKKNAESYRDTGPWWKVDFVVYFLYWQSASQLLPFERSRSSMFCHKQKSMSFGNMFKSLKNQWSRHTESQISNNVHTRRIIFPHSLKVFWKSFFYFKHQHIPMDSSQFSRCYIR